MQFEEAITEFERVHPVVAQTLSVHLDKCRLRFPCRRDSAEPLAMAAAALLRVAHLVAKDLVNEGLLPEEEMKQLAADIHETEVDMRVNWDLVHLRPHGKREVERLTPYLLRIVTDPFQRAKESRSVGRMCVFGMATLVLAGRVIGLFEHKDLHDTMRCAREHLDYFEQFARHYRRKRDLWLHCQLTIGHLDRTLSWLPHVMRLCVGRNEMDVELLRTGKDLSQCAQSMWRKAASDSMGDSLIPSLTEVHIPVVHVSEIVLTPMDGLEEQVRALRARLEAEGKVLEDMHVPNRSVWKDMYHETMAEVVEIAKHVTSVDTSLIQSRCLEALST